MYAPSAPVSIPAHPVLGPLVTIMLTVIMVVILLVTMGPIADYFASMLAGYPADAAGYVNPVLQMFVQWYWLLALAVGCAITAGFLGVIRYLTYSRYGD